MRALHSAHPVRGSALPAWGSAFPEPHSALPEPHSALPERHLALPELRSESQCPGAVRHAARVAYPSRGSRVVAEFESEERRRAVRPVKAMALRPRVVAEAAEFESAEQPRVAGSVPEAMMALQRRAAAAPARSFAEAGSEAQQARRLAESEASAPQAAAVLPAAWDAAVVLLRAEEAPQVAARDVAEAPRQEAEVRVGAAVPRPEEAAAQAGVAEVARPPAARDAAAVLRRAARGARALPSAAVLPFPCRLRVRLAPQPAARFARAMKRLRIASP